MQVNEDLRRPRGPFPSLPGGVDAVMKTYTDGFRNRKALPPELQGVTAGRLYEDQAQLDRWRDALRGDFRVTDRTLGVEVLGGLDDLLAESDGLTPLDFKTRGWPVKEDSHAHYEHQLDLYTWILERLGQPVSGRGVLLFFSPVAYRGNGAFQFRTEPVTVQTSTKRAAALLARAVKILKGPPPKEHADCAFCRFAVARNGIAED